MPTFDPRTPKVHPLHIPELVDLICKLLSLSDSLCLMRTSRRICPLVAPVIWRDVEGSDLMELIVEKPALAKDDVHSDLKSSSVDLTRFDFYSPFVRQLQVRSRAARFLTGQRRRACVLRAKQGTLLPKLTSLALVTSSTSLASDGLFWLDLLLKPSVRHLRICPLRDPSTAWISYQTATALWEKLAVNTPALTSLELYPMNLVKNNNQNSTENTTWLAKALPDPRSLSQLRSITGSMGVFHGDGFAFLGALPSLQSLTISLHNRYKADQELSMLGGSFLSLTELNLLHMDIRTLQVITNATQLFANLTSLRINLSWIQITERSHPMIQAWFSREFPALLGYARHLKSFTVELDTTNAYSVSYVWIRNPVPLFAALSELPLEQVSISRIRFPDDDYVDDIVAAFPQVVSLHMPHHAVLGRNLYRLAELVHLKHLALGEIRFESGVSLPRPKSSALVEIKSMIALTVADDLMDMKELSGEVEQVTRFMLSLWPRLTHVAVPDSYPPDRPRTRSIAEEVNLMILKIRSTVEVNGA